MLGWEDVQSEALRRIQTREWIPGELIPNEQVFADELGCARATVNRALRALAQDGYLERRRKAGTRVAISPQRKARLSIPLIRHEVEGSGATYSHAVIKQAHGKIPAAERLSLSLAANTPCFEIITVHFAGTKPFALETRWVNLGSVPGFEHAPLDKISANEWLVQNAPFSHGTLNYHASAASQFEAAQLDCPEGTALMNLVRHTFGPDAAVTWVRIRYAPGYHLTLEI
jgi:GntR family histidine utilization transcriptional repressor